MSSWKQVANTHPTNAFMSTSRQVKWLHMDLFGPTTYTCAGGNLDEDVLHYYPLAK
jgi:hypothetical protein